MTPVAEIQVIEGAGEQWKPDVSNNNTIAANAVASKPLINGNSSGEDDQGSAASNSDDVDRNGVENLTSLMQSQGPIAIYPPEYMNGISSRYPEQFTNGDVHVNGFKESSSQVDNGSIEDLSPEDLAGLVRHQFEYYFSRENLNNDVYLVSQMDDDQYVPIQTVAGFKQIKKLTADLGFIVEALKESPYIQLDSSGTKVRANMKRCIVILREIPEATPIEEIEGLFTSEKCPKWTSCEFVNNDSWYVTFASEEDAQQAYCYIRQDVRTFRGRPIMARIKAKTLLSRTVFMPKNGVRTETVEGAQAPFATQPPLTSNGMAIQPQVFQQIPYQYYIPTSAWMSNGSPHFYSPESFTAASSGYATNSFVSNGGRPLSSVSQRHYQFTGKSRQPNGKGGFHRETHIDRYLDRDNGQPSPHRRHSSSSSSSHTSTFPRKDTEIPPRRQSLKKQDVPRFQRLRQDKERRQLGLETRKPEEPVSQLNLAPENFPALPSPKSPSLSDKFASCGTTTIESSTVEIAPAADEKCQEVELAPEPPRTSSSSSSTANIPFDSRMSYAQMAQRPLGKGLSIEIPAATATSHCANTKQSPLVSSKAKSSKVIVNGIDTSPHSSINRGPILCSATEFPAPCSKDEIPAGDPTSGLSQTPTKNAAALSNKDSYAARMVQNLPSQQRKTDASNTTPQLPPSPSKLTSSNGQSTVLEALMSKVTTAPEQESQSPAGNSSTQPPTESKSSGSASVLSSPAGSKDVVRSRTNPWSR